MPNRSLMKSARKAKRISQEELAEAVGLSTSQISRFERGTREPRAEDVRKIAEVLGLSIASLMEGSPPLVGGVAKTGSPRSVPVLGEAATGRWMEHEGTPEQTNDLVPAIPGRFGSFEQFAYAVIGPSMESAKIHHGDYVICVPYASVREAPSHGDIVVIERRNGDLIEQSCRQLEINGGRIEFWSRTTDKRFQNPVRIQKLDGVANVTELPSEDGTKVNVVGLVIGRYSPIFELG
jgi:transcriptional regulator with XRE-family HTH domain